MSGEDCYDNRKDLKPAVLKLLLAVELMFG